MTVSARALFVCLAAALALSACAAQIPRPAALDPRTTPFIPRSDFPVPPNVERLIGPEDCRGATLRAVEAGLPDYPARAWGMGLQGWTVVRFHVYDTGRTARVRVARSVPSGHFDRAARRAVEGWRFQPLPPGTHLDNCVVLFEFRLGEVRIR
ncbi:MAG: energy transducer TonB [Maricaulaceae bacterium]|nr:energy transducer TonB [Maricaulaceae bacterium]